MNPVWDDAKFTCPLLHLNSKVTLKLYDKDKNASEFLGQVSFELATLPRQMNQSISLPVERAESAYKAQGKITFNAFIEVFSLI